MLINILIVTDDIPGWDIKISRELNDAVTYYYPEREGRRTIETNLFRFSIISDFVEARLYKDLDSFLYRELLTSNEHDDLRQNRK